MIKLSIVIPVYNVEQFLKRCVESVLRQNLDASEYEVLLINDGSTDKSGAIAEGFAEKFSQIRYFSQKNEGLGAARNMGIKNASGTYLLFLDSDDWLEGQVLKNLLSKAISEDMDLLIYDSQRIFVSGERKKIEVSYQPEKIYSGEELITETRVDILPCANFYKKEILERNSIQFEEGVFYEDPDFYLKFILNSKRIQYVPTMVYDYFFNENSITINSEKKHTDKKIQDYAFAALRIKELKKNQSEKVQQKFDFLIEKYQLILMQMMYRNDVEFSVVSKILNAYKKAGLYPFKIRQQWKDRDMDAQLFYLNRFLDKPYFFKKRFNGAVLLMKINKRIKLF